MLVRKIPRITSRALRGRVLAGPCVVSSGVSEVGWEVVGWPRAGARTQGRRCHDCLQMSSHLNAKHGLIYMPLGHGSFKIRNIILKSTTQEKRGIPEFSHLIEGLSLLLLIMPPDHTTKSWIPKTLFQNSFMLAIIIGSNTWANPVTRIPTKKFQLSKS